MRRTLSSSEHDFERRIKTFLKAHRPVGPAGYGAAIWLQQSWCDALVDHGYATPGWPADMGGPGWTETQKFLWYRSCHEQIQQFAEPASVAVVGPLLAQFASQTVQNQHLRPIRALTERWCVAFQETQLPVLTTNGAQTLLSGCAQWVSGAKDAHYVLGWANNGADRRLLFSCPMDRRGVRIETVQTLSGNELNHLHFDHVELAVHDVVAKVGVSAAGPNRPGQLALGRSAIARTQLEQLDKILQELDPQDDLHAQRHAAAVEVSALEALEMRYVDALQRAVTPPFSADLLSLRAASVENQVGSLLMDGFGYYALPYPDLWLNHNEGEVGPEGARAATSAWLARTVSENYASVCQDIYAKIAREQQDTGEL